MQSLPAGYFYFYIDLPQGVIAKAYTDKTNRIDSSAPPGSLEVGSYVPPTSIITQIIGLDIFVEEGDVADTSVWAMKTSNEYTAQAEYMGLLSSR